MRGDHEWTVGEKEQMRGLKSQERGRRESGTSGGAKMDQERLKGAQQQRWKTARNWKRLKRDKRWAEEGVSNEWKRARESMKKPNKSKKKRGEETKREIEESWKIEARETFAGSLSVNHNLLGVGYERERAQFCSGYHYHHRHNHNQGNSSVGRWKGGWQRVMEEDKMSDRRNKDITRCNHGEMCRDRDAVGGWAKDRGVEETDR